MMHIGVWLFVVIIILAVVVGAMLFGRHRF